MKEPKIAEVEFILKGMPIDILKMFSKMRKNPEIWDGFQKYFKIQRDTKLYDIYRLKRPKNQDQLVSNALEHEYHAARVTSLIIELQLMEYADSEMERRENKEK